MHETPVFKVSKNLRGFYVKKQTTALLSDNMTTIKEKELLKKFEVIQEMSEEEKSMVFQKQ
jgi:hypothetical protein